MLTAPFNISCCEVYMILLQSVGSAVHHGDTSAQVHRHPTPALATHITVLVLLRAAHPPTHPPTHATHAGVTRTSP
jgi:hypothetical protein